MTVRFLEIAEIELDQAIHWYGAQAPGLGNAFLIEVLSAADRIARFPEAWHPLDEGVRRCRLSRFPYGLIYTIDNGDMCWRSLTCIAGQTIGAIASSDDLPGRLSAEATLHYPTKPPSEPFTKRAFSRRNRQRRPRTSSARLLCGVCPRS